MLECIDDWNTDEEKDSFFSEYGLVNEPKAIQVLNEESVRHAFSRQDQMRSSSYEGEAFVVEDRYLTEVFQGIMLDSGAAGISTAGKQQVQALMKIDPSLKIDRTDN